MLIPKFTIRRLLILTAVCAVISLVGTFAFRGQPWAIALIVALAAFVMGFGAYLFFFLVVRIMSAIADLFVTPGPTSPFAQHRPPPQVIPPDEPT
jgi:hypothetical protein